LEELVTLMRFDPFRELDRLGESTLSAGTAPSAPKAVRRVHAEDRSRLDPLTRRHGHDHADGLDDVAELEDVKLSAGVRRPPTEAAQYVDTPAQGRDDALGLG
jgi:hypothetical protein